MSGVWETMSHVTQSAAGRSDDLDARRRRTGWLLVAIQAILLIAFVILPKRRSLLATPDFLDVLGIILMIGGLAVLLIAFISLGSALTPTPVPQEAAALRTHGVYAHVRHPIYSGILLAALGFTLAVGSIWQVLLLVSMAVFFYGKAFWEDRLLAEKHGVAWFDYADHVSGFIPRFWGSR